ncbi:MAG: MarR family transcriptional regulator [Melioribacteraceae bacterium]|nr:MarR family transcriptional regulator [Melioribacteraceae bacterium]
MTDKKRRMALELLSNLSRVHAMFEDFQAKHLIGEYLSITKFESLKALLKAGPIPLNEISKVTFVTTANITYVIDQLEETGYIKRTNSTKDRRVIQAELTEIGKDKIESILPKYSEKLANITSRLTPTEQKEMIRILDKLNL